ncbi:MAG: histidine kinase dimerization/phospho-acceptor domain-containing protein, partial [Gemmatimonadaceae bacterium]
MMLRTRLTLGIGSIVILMMVPILLSLRSMEQLRITAERIRDTDFKDAVKLGQIRSVLQEINQTKDYVALFPSDRTRDQFAQRIAQARSYLDSLSGSDDGRLVPRLRSSLESIEEESLRAHELAVAKRPELADSVVDRSIIPMIKDIDNTVNLIEDAVQERTRRRVNEIAAESATSRQTNIILLTGTALLAVLIGLWLTQSVSRPIDELDAGMRAVSDGDFGHPLQLAPQRGDEFGRLAKSFNSMATQLRELDRLKAEFISVASHELKTPINVVMGYLQLLTESVYGELNGRQREIVGTLTAQTKSLSRLVRQLLDVSRFEAGGGKVEPRPIPLPAFLGDLERTFRVLAIQRTVEFGVIRSGNLPPEVLWDPERINEVLGNLLSNAFK